MGKLFDQKRQELLAKEEALRGKKSRQSSQKRKPKKRR
jgi:hypothetical protein